MFTRAIRLQLWQDRRAEDADFAKDAKDGFGSGGWLPADPALVAGIGHGERASDFYGDTETGSYAIAGGGDDLFSGSVRAGFGYF